MSVCQKCGNKQVTAIDKDLPLKKIVQIIKSCVCKEVPFLPIDLSTSLWAEWIQRVPYCIKFVTHNSSAAIRVAFESEGIVREADLIYRHGTKSHGAKYASVLDRDDIMYIATTSGTTRPQPKIVYVTKSCIQPNINEFRNQMNITSKSVLYCSSPLTFDPAILTILIAIATGCEVVYREFKIGKHVELLQYLKRSCVTHIQAVPSFLRLLNLHSIAQELLSHNTSVEVISLGGEPCLTGADLSDMCGGSETLIKRIKFFNVYGLTEQSVWSSVYQIDSDYIVRKCMDPVPIGTALSQTTFKLKADSNSGEAELRLCSQTRLCYIDIGDGITESYDLDTGDMVTQSHDQIYVTGRKNADFVKRAGLRLNLLFLSQYAERHPDVQQASSIYDKEKGLVLVYSGVLPPGGVENHLTSSLPPHYIPDRIIQLDHLPVNSHGKLNRKKLLELVEGHMKESIYYSSLCIIQSYFSGDCSLDIDKTFVENGGSSVQALALSCQLSEMSHTPDTQHQVLQAVLNQNICELCHYVDSFSLPAASTKSREDNSPPSKKLKVSLNSSSTLPEILTVVQKDCLTNPCPSFPSNTSLHAKRLWEVDTGKCVDATPTLISTGEDNFAYVGSHSHKFLCINMSNGEVVWSTILGGRIEATAAISQKHRLIFVGCYDKHLYCLQAFTGDVMYKHLTGDVIKSTPAVDSGRVYFGSHDHHFYCLSLPEFSLLWKVRLKGAIYATPVISENGILVATLNGSIYLIDKTTGVVKEEVSLGAPIFSTVLLAVDKVVVCTVTGLCTCRQTDNLSQELWSYKAAGAIFSSPCLVADEGALVFGCHDKHVYCLDMHTGRLLWNVLCDATVGCSPFPYKTNTSNHVMISSTRGTLYSVNVCTGDVTSFLALHADVFSSPIVSGSRLIIGCRDDKIYCFELIS